MAILNLRAPAASQVPENPTHPLSGLFLLQLVKPVLDVLPPPLPLQQWQTSARCFMYHYASRHATSSNLLISREQSYNNFCRRRRLHICRQQQRATRAANMKGRPSSARPATRPQHFDVSVQAKYEHQQKQQGSISEILPSFAALGTAVPSSLSAEPDSNDSAIDSPNLLQSIELITGRPIATSARPRPRPQSAKGQHAHLPPPFHISLALLVICCAVKRCHSHSPSPLPLQILQLYHPPPSTIPLSSPVTLFPFCFTLLRCLARIVSAAAYSSPGAS